MLPVLLNVPASKEDWDRWSFHHRTSHDLINKAIFSDQAVLLPDFILDPIDLEEPKLFIEANQLAHSSMNNALLLPGSDLEQVDLDDQRQLQAWIFLHYQEHRTAERRLGIAS